MNVVPFWHFFHDDSLRQGLYPKNWAGWTVSRSRFFKSLTTSSYWLHWVGRLFMLWRWEASSWQKLWSYDFLRESKLSSAGDEDGATSKESEFYATSWASRIAYNSRTAKVLLFVRVKCEKWRKQKKMQRTTDRCSRLCWPRTTAFQAVFTYAWDRFRSAQCNDGPDWRPWHE